MGILTAIFGAKNNVSWWPESNRAVVIFSYGVVLLRLTGRRTFGHWSAVDVMISVIVSSALARAVTDNAPYPGTILAAAVMVLLHVGVSYLVPEANGLRIDLSAARPS